MLKSKKQNYKNWEMSDSWIAARVYVQDALAMCGYSGIRFRREKSRTALPGCKTSIRSYLDPTVHYIPVPAGPYVRSGMVDIACRQLAIALCGGMSSQGIWVRPGCEQDALITMVNFYESVAPGFSDALYEYLEFYHDTDDVPDDVMQSLDCLFSCAVEGNVMKKVESYLSKSKLMYRSASHDSMSPAPGFDVEK